MTSAELTEKQNFLIRCSRFTPMLTHLCSKLQLVGCTTAGSWNEGNEGKSSCCCATFYSPNKSRIVLQVKETIFRLKVELTIRSKDVSPYSCHYQEKHRYEFSSDVCDSSTDIYSIDEVLSIHKDVLFEKGV